jgi:GH18 family chitinase
MRRFFSVMVIVVILLVTAGCTQNTLPAPGRGNPSQHGDSPEAGTGQVPSAAAGGKVIAAYWYLYPDPNDDTYPLVLQAKDRIPWTKINRLYIGFATVKDGELTDLPTGDSSDDTARRAEMQRRIREIVALCRTNNPDAEIFIVSNFDEKELDPQYLLAAQDPEKFADSVADYLEGYDLDGYDMDWESGRIDDYAPQLTSLLSACHDRFAAGAPTQRGQRYLLTHTVWPGVESAETVAGLEDSVDQLNLMTYGPGHTYDLTSHATAYHDAGFPYEKMIGGIESESGYGESGGHDTQESVAAKCTYVKENNLAGLFEWRIDNDMRPENSPPTYQVTGWMSDGLSRE